MERPALLDCPSFPVSVFDTTRKSINMKTGIVLGLILGYQQQKYDAHLITSHCWTRQPQNMQVMLKFFVTT